MSNFNCYSCCKSYQSSSLMCSMTGKSTPSTYDFYNIPNVCPLSSKVTLEQHIFRLLVNKKVIAGW